MGTLERTYETQMFIEGQFLHSTAATGITVVLRTPVAYSALWRAVLRPSATFQ
jgi:hypothetical protein